MLDGANGMAAGPFFIEFQRKDTNTIEGFADNKYAQARRNADGHGAPDDCDKDTVIRCDAPANPDPKQKCLRCQETMQVIVVEDQANSLGATISYFGLKLWPMVLLLFRTHLPAMLMTLGLYQWSRTRDTELRHREYGLQTLGGYFVSAVCGALVTYWIADDGAMTLMYWAFSLGLFYVVWLQASRVERAIKGRDLSSDQSSSSNADAFSRLIHNLTFDAAINGCALILAFMLTRIYGFDPYAVWPLSYLASPPPRVPTIRSAALTNASLPLSEPIAVHMEGDPTDKVRHLRVFKDELVDPRNDASLAHVRHEWLETIEQANKGVRPTTDEPRTKMDALVQQRVLQTMQQQEAAEQEARLRVKAIRCITPFERVGLAVSAVLPNRAQEPGHLSSSKTLAALNLASDVVDLPGHGSSLCVPSVLHVRRLARLFLFLCLL